MIVKDLSRVGRNHIETGFYTEVYFARMGVRFIAVNNGMVFTDTHEPIVSEELWQAAQRIFHPEMSGNTVRSRSVLCGLMICGECGKPMTLHTKSHDEGNNEFICSTHRKSEGYASACVRITPSAFPLSREL